MLGWVSTLLVLCHGEEVNMDILSDALRVVRLTGAIFFNAELSSPWAFYSPPGEELRRHLHSSSECLTLFHILEQGHCWISLDGVTAFQMHQGDAIVFPHASSHIMSSLQAPPPSSVHPVPIDLIMNASKDRIPSLAFGGDGERSRFICGYLQCDQRFNPLVASLPVFLWLCHDHGDDSLVVTENGNFPPSCILPIEKGHWLETTLQYTIQEVCKGNPGNAAMSARLLEVMFVEVLRRYMQQLPSAYDGWLAAVRDRSVGHVLQLMHTQPERIWTVEDLATEAAISRSSLAQRFTSLVGETPMQYLAGWRMQLAKHMLRETNLSIGEIAARIGYTSEVAFNHAFKRHIGQPPVTWRRRKGLDRESGVFSSTMNDYPDGTLDRPEYLSKQG